MPEGLLFGSTKAHVELRRKLIEDFEWLAVVSLPAGVFKPYAGVKTDALGFRYPASGPSPHRGRGKGEGESPSDNRKVWFYDVRADGYAPDKIVSGGRPEAPDRNDIPDLLRQWRAYKQSGFKNPPGVEAGTRLEPGPRSRAAGGLR